MQNLYTSFIKTKFERILRPRAHESGPFGSVPKLERIDLTYPRNLLYPIQFGSAIRTSLDRINSHTSLDLIHSGPVWTHGSDQELEQVRNEACFHY